MKKLLLLLLVIFSCDSPTGLNEDEFVIEFKHYYCGTERYTKGEHFGLIIFDANGNAVDRTWDTTKGKKLIFTFDKFQFCTYKLVFGVSFVKEGTIIFGEKDVIYACI